MTGPCSRIFQAIATDLAVAVNTVISCKSTLQKKREDRSYYDQLNHKAKQFAEAHGIDPEQSLQQRRKIRRRYADGSADGREANANQDMQHADDLFYVDVYVPAIDLVLSDLSSRYDDNMLPVVRQMMIFSASSLQTTVDVLASDVDIFCAKYCFEASEVVRELNSFKVLFTKNKHLVSMKDISQKLAMRTESTVESEENETTTGNHWIRHTFLQPYRLLYQLSGFPTLLTVYKVLVTIAVTSASAERAMSKVKLIKNRLRSTMTDDFFSSLMIIAAEKDLADKLTNDCIIQRFAALSPVLRKYLICS